MSLGKFKVAVLAAGAACIGLAPLVAAQAADSWKQPMTEWGEPDLQGKWPIGDLTGVPFERPKKFGTRKFLNDEEYAQRLKADERQNERYAKEVKENKMGMGHWTEGVEPQRRTSILIDPPDGRLPEMTAEGKRLSSQMRSSWQKIKFNSPADFDTWDRCITRGMPASMFAYHYNNGIQIIQSPGYVVIRLEMIHESRIIPTDGRPSLPSNILNWMGESRGHWDGNTLVIETTNLKPGPSATNIGVVGSPPFNNTPISTKARITERLTMKDQNHIDYTVTMDDPVVFTKPWTANETWTRDPSYGFYEYACHEDNYTIRNYINSSRAGKQAANVQ